MENQEFLDEEVIASNDEVETDDEENGEGLDNKPNKNKSNFKELHKKTKVQEKALLEKEERLASLEAELTEWRNLNPELADILKANKEISDINEKIFVLENAEAKPHLKEIKQTMKEFNVWYEKAWKLVKVDLPEESITKKDFSIWKTNVNKKDLSKVTPEEALELPKEKRREWRKIHWYG